MSFNFTESHPSNDYPISPLDTEGFGYQVGFPDNLISYNFMPNSISNDLQISHPDAPHNDTSSKHDATESIVANELNASTSHDLNYDVSLKDDLNKAFKAIKAPGTFAVWGALPTTPPAGLNVEGVGDVALPLQEEKIRQLIDKSHQAPYGRRSETLVDVSVRNTWEINGDQLHFFDPAWLHYLLDLSKRVATDLGIEAPIRLDLYKMLIYETGAMFKAHTDTEKTPGMFGTLIICLPSVHTGGEVTVKHHGQTKTLRTSDATQSYACWYSDAMHEVLPVQSGYRCVLTYNLAVKPGLTRPTATAPEYQNANIRKTLEIWLNELKSRQVESHLYCPFEHEYTEAAMSIGALKTNDLARAKVMQDLTSELPFDVFLALLQKEDQGSEEDGPNYNRYKRSRNSLYDSPKTGGGTHAMSKITRTSYAVKSLQALDGTLIAERFDFDMNSCLEKDPFLDLTVTDEHHEPYMGNWGPSSTYWYRRATLVIVPHSEVGNYLAKCASRNDRSTMCYLARVCSLPTAREHMLDALFKLCKPRSIHGLPPGTIRDILQVALQHSSYEVFKSIAGSHGGELPDTFFEWAKEWLNTVAESERFEKYQNWIPLLLDGYPSLANHTNIAQRILCANADAEPTSTSWVQVFIHRSISTFAQTVGAPTAEDGRVMVSAAFRLNEPWANISASLALIFGRFQKHPHEWLDTLPESERLEKYQKWIPSLLFGYPSLDHRISIVQKISGATGDVEPTSQPWARDLVRQSIINFLGTIGMPTAEEASVIVSAVFTLNDPWANTSVLLTLIFDCFPQAHAAAFSLAFLSRFKILASSTETQFPVSDTMELWRNLSSRFFTRERTPGNIIASANSMPSSHRHAGLTPRALVEFACDLTNFNAHGENLMEPFIQQICVHCTGFSAQDMCRFWMPFFYDLTRGLAYRSASLTTTSYKQLTLQFIQRLDGQMLGPCPQVGVRSRRPQVACSCGDCRDLNRFLRDSSQTVVRFKLIQARRKHLEDTLIHHSIACTQKTERMGSPQTLVVTKKYTLQDEINEWKKRQKQLYASLNRNIQPEHLKDILGDQEFARVCTLAGGNVLTNSNLNSSSLA
ncbi:hypothetical protein PCANC_19359 [Puccinia coronata f. sp. avenae]|uniref:Prolyl 4-hydroxylase alpha subunit Fe(2+) 2OG dioxygenase domain-containing protein n=1 Tax=Puccinia coronata f. sp. avenae TaxID=200324 RepID=A0A2N5SDI8_9BASI|nr:hypothetical protein PCANC_19359 [Puccinia coronata f. sp. avenae]PLW51430.1 hypothetical protein PCASD_00286 [Puccinia coronata f. sp. avenae]